MKRESGEAIISQIEMGEVALEYGVPDPGTSSMYELREQLPVDLWPEEGNEEDPNLSILVRAVEERVGEGVLGSFILCRIIEDQRVYEFWAPYLLKAE